MAKIIFLNPFVPTLLTGGIKVMYQHAEALAELGFFVEVWLSSGPMPEWLSARQKSLIVHTLTFVAADVLVFPEPLNGWLREFALSDLAVKKVLFCQNQYYMYCNDLKGSDYLQCGFQNFIVPGHTAKSDLCSFFEFSDQAVHVVPAFIDCNFFRVASKRQSIVYAPRKWPAQAGLPSPPDLFQKMLSLKYPQFSNVSWVQLENMSPQDVANAMAEASIFLSLSRMECVPLTPLEAMASGCIVVGYHGTGGLEYASHQNGFWYSPEEHEQIVDALATVLVGRSENSPVIQTMLFNAQRTVSQFNKEKSMMALQKVYGKILSP